MASQTSSPPRIEGPPRPTWPRSIAIIIVIVLVVLSAAFHFGASHLALLGLLTITALLIVILTDAMAPLVALIAVPIAGALAAGFGLQISNFIVSGVEGIAPVAGMFIFAILYFGIMSDAGMLDPIIDTILRGVGTRPTRIVMGSALLALLIHLDGSGAVCFLITIPAMLPIYERLGMDKRILALGCSLAAGVNFLPWTGPTIRAAAALHVTTVELFLPILKVQIVGLIFVFAVCYFLGKREEKRLGLAKSSDPAPARRRLLTASELALRRPQNFIVNAFVTLVIIAAMIAGWLDPVVAFMLGAVLALVINYPSVTMQKERVNAHAEAALLMAGILFAAGAFTGIMTRSNMLHAMAIEAAAHLPKRLETQIPFALGTASMPLSLLFDPDSFYFGVLPVLADVYGHAGGNPIHVGQAALMGQMTVGFPISPLTPATFLVVGLCGIELRSHQKFSIPYLLAASLLMTLACVLLGVFPL